MLLMTRRKFICSTFDEIRKTSWNCDRDCNIYLKISDSNIGWIKFQRNCDICSGDCSEHWSECQTEKVPPLKASAHEIYCPFAQWNFNEDYWPHRNLLSRLYFRIFLRVRGCKWEIIHISGVRLWSSGLFGGHHNQEVLHSSVFCADLWEFSDSAAVVWRSDGICGTIWGYADQQEALTSSAGSQEAPAEGGAQFSVDQFF